MDAPRAGLQPHASSLRQLATPVVLRSTRERQPVQRLCDLTMVHQSGGGAYMKVVASVQRTGSSLQSSPTAPPSLRRHVVVPPVVGVSRIVASSNTLSGGGKRERDGKYKKVDANIQGTGPSLQSRELAVAFAQRFAMALGTSSSSPLRTTGNLPSLPSPASPSMRGLPSTPATLPRKVTPTFGSSSSDDIEMCDHERKLQSIAGNNMGLANFGLASAATSNTRTKGGAASNVFSVPSSVGTALTGKTHRPRTDESESESSNCDDLLPLFKKTRPTCKGARGTQD